MYWQFLLAYLQAANATEGPLFRTANRKTTTLTKNAMTGIEICRMMKRRLKLVGLPGHSSPHSFRGTTVTDLLEQNAPLEDVRYLAGHVDPRARRINDRRRRKVTRNIVERTDIPLNGQSNPDSPSNAIDAQVSGLKRIGHIRSEKERRGQHRCSEPPKQDDII